MKQMNLFGEEISQKNKYNNLEKVRERGIQYGPNSLNDIELIMALLEVEETRAEELLCELGGICGLINSSTEQIIAIKGIGPVKATRIKAALELSKRIALKSMEEKPVIKSPEDVAELVMEDMRYMDREYFRAMLLNTKNRVLSVETISIGTLSSSVVHPRELFNIAIKKSAAAVILIHNHPSGDPTPSREDIEVTKRLEAAGKIIGIDILDHIIIGAGKHVSLQAKELF